MVDWAYRFWQALNTNPDGITQEQTGPFMRSFATQPALGITDRDCQLLRKAIGMTGVGVISTTRGPVEMADPCDGLYDCEDSLTTAFSKLWVSLSPKSRTSSTKGPRTYRGRSSFVSRTTLMVTGSCGSFGTGT